MKPQSEAAGAPRPPAAGLKYCTMNVGLIGWRGMVGSVLVERMREERDFDLIDPVFFSTSQTGAEGPSVGKRTPAVKNAKDLAELTALRRPDLLPGRRLHDGDLPEAARRGLERLLDRRRLDAADEGSRRPHPRPRQPRRHRRRAGGGRQGLHRPQLHREPDADGDDRPLPRRPRRVGHVDDLPGRVGRRCQEHARADRADGPPASRRRGAAGRPGVGHPRHRSRRDRRAALARAADRANSAGTRSPGACCPGSPRTSATARARKSGRRWPRATRSSARPASRWTACASASARCGATARRSPSS